MTTSTSKLKQMAAERAVEHIQSGMVVGLGTGSTALFAIQRLASLLASSLLKDIVAIPSSVRSRDEAVKLGIPLTGFDTHPIVDITIDGADEVDPALNLIKGGGGALLREKIVAQASTRLVVIVDSGKLVSHLGETFPLPVEVVSFGWETQLSFLQDLGAKVNLRRTDQGEPFITDQHNLILDCDFGPIRQMAELNQALNQRAGIVEHGLFLGMADEVIVASPQGITQLTASGSSS
jgi:ribose 5-phosphate isomerase A